VQRVKNMSRVGWAVTGIGIVTVVASVVLTASGAASAVPSGGALVPSRPHHNQGTASGELTHGGAWTYYDFDPFIGYAEYCEVLTFSSTHTFSGDKGDDGKWRGDIDTAAPSGSVLRLTFNPTTVSGTLWDALDGLAGGSSGPVTYLGKYVPHRWIGSASQAGFGLETASVFPGDDPLGRGC
jgi:hypothetical protein